jgi:hypothetical protein
VTELGRATTVVLPQPSTSSMMSSNSRSVMRLGYTGVVQHIEGRRGVRLARHGLQRSDGEIGWQLRFQYLQIKIHHRTDTIYRAFCTES